MWCVDIVPLQRDATCKRAANPERNLFHGELLLHIFENSSIGHIKFIQNTCGNGWKEIASQRIYYGMLRNITEWEFPDIMEYYGYYVIPYYDFYGILRTVILVHSCIGRMCTPVLSLSAPHLAH